MAQKDLWVSILERLQPTIKKAHFITWFQFSTALAVKDGILQIAVPTVYAENWIASKYAVKVLQAAQEIDSKIVDLSFEVDGQLESSGQGVDVRNMFKEQTQKKIRKVRNINEVSVKTSGGPERVRSKILNVRYTLNNFISGGENRLPHAACEAVVNMPGGIYNPLYIYGSVGMGKTHLLHAIGNGILRTRPDLVVKYITAEKFVNEVVEAIGKRHMKQFKDRYRNVDCLLIDDIQFFANKKTSQEELFNTFNHLYEMNKQIVFASDRPPSELNDLDLRLKDRFAMGMVVELVAPEFETRMAILQQKSQEFESLVDPVVLDFIANNVQTNVRTLEGVLRQMVAECQLLNVLPSIKMAAEIIRRMNKAQAIVGYDFEANANKNIVKTAGDIINLVADYYEIDVEELLGQSRKKTVMYPRQVCMYLIKQHLDESYEKIGSDFGGRNHTTVMHACNKLGKQLKNDVRLMGDLNALKREMGF